MSLTGSVSRWLRRAPHPTFRDSALERRLARDGYVVLPLLSAEQVAQVWAVRGELGVGPGDPRSGMFNDSWSTDRDYTRDLSRRLGALLDPVIDRLCVDHAALIWGTSVKWPGDGGEVGAHRDPTFVDEHRFRSIGVFCAIDDLDDLDGTLAVVPGSHRQESRVRVHQSISNLYPDVDARGAGAAAPLRLSAGTGIVYDHSLIHRSAPSHRSDARVVVMGVVVPRAAQPCYAIRVGAGTAALLEVGPEFFLDQRVDAIDVDAALRGHTRIATVPVVERYGTSADG